MFKVKRIYDPAARSDGYRVLVDRLWPRGISKEKAEIDEWLKIATPSDELRSWFHKDKDKRFKEFSQKYLKELKENKKEIRDEKKKWKKNTTLITAVKDIDHSHIPTLLKFLHSI